MKIFLTQIACILMISIGTVAAKGLKVIRPNPGDVNWTKEYDEVIQRYKNTYKPPQDSEVFLLFTAVNLRLSQSVARDGAEVQELAFICAESPDEKGEVRRKVTVWSRFPYEDRQWEQIYVIVEGGPIADVLSLDPSRDILGQLSEFSKKLALAPAPRDYITSVILFEKDVFKIFGKKLDDESIASIFN